MALNFTSKLTKFLSHSTPKRLSTLSHMASSQPHLKPLNSKLSNFMKNGLLHHAHQLFDEMPEKDTITYNAMIRGYFLNNLPDRAIHLFRLIPSPDIYSYNTLIHGLMCSGQVKFAKDVFESMPYRNLITWNSMIAGYIRNSMLDDAVSIFDAMEVKDAFSWNLVIGGVLKAGELDWAIKLFDEMGNRNRDLVSCTLLVSGLMDAGRIGEARLLFDRMEVKDVRVWNKVLAGYLKNGEFESAESIFRSFPERDLESWRILISGLVDNRRIKEAMRVFFDMPKKCARVLDMIVLRLVESKSVKVVHGFLEKTPFLDVVSLTNLIVGYFKISEVDTAMKIFNETGTRDTAIWNATIFGLGENKRFLEGLRLFTEMKESGEYPNISTFTSVTKICSDLPSLDFGKQIHSQAIITGFSKTTSVSNALLTMYARSGTMRLARSVFQSMPNRDLISWNALISGYANHGDGEKALKTFEEMESQNIKPDGITFVAVLSACCHTGFVEKGKHYFNLMRREYSIQPTGEHYTCVVNMLGRKGLVEEAMEFLDRMREDGEEIPGSVFGALFDSCRVYRNFEIGEVVGRKLLEIESWNVNVYLSLAEMYRENGRVADAEGILEQMRSSGVVKKFPGFSSVEVSKSGSDFG